MSHKPLTTEQRAATIKARDHYRELLGLCYHKSNERQITDQLEFLDHLLTHGVPEQWPLEK